MKKFGSKDWLLCLFSCVLTLIVIAFSAGEIKNGEVMPTEKNLKNVKKAQLSGEFCILLSCEELAQYSAFSVNFDTKAISVTLFDSKKTAETYGFTYDRKVKYSKFDEIEIIGRIGGIVIGDENCYNKFYESYGLYNVPSRIYGNTAVSMSSSDISLRTDVALSFFADFLNFGMTKSDFSYIIGLVDSDISVTDYLKYWDSIRPFSQNITISPGY